MLLVETGNNPRVLNETEREVTPDISEGPLKLRGELISKRGLTCQETH